MFNSLCAQILEGFPGLVQDETMYEPSDHAHPKKCLATTDVINAIFCGFFSKRYWLLTVVTDILLTMWYNTLMTRLRTKQKIQTLISPNNEIGLNLHISMMQSWKIYFFQIAMYCLLLQTFLIATLHPRPPNT